MDNDELIRVYLRVAKVRMTKFKLQNNKNDAVKRQDFKTAAIWRDRERIMEVKIEELDAKLSSAYTELFPEESKELDDLLILKSEQPT